jgi:poly-gamma-glutamate synthesis protein (capsule biosynthesis protein)
VKALKVFSQIIIFPFFLLISPFSPQGETSAGEITVVAVGDTYPGGRAAPFIKKYGYGYLFEPTREILKGADLVIANLEAPLTQSEDILMDKKYILKADPKAAEGIKDASIDVVTLANNHIMDYGEAGLRDTKQALDRYGVLYTGAGENVKEARKPAIYEADGVKIAVLAYSNTFPKVFYAKKGSPGTAPGYAKYVRRDVRAARSAADIVIVSFHWSADRLKIPKDYQVSLAHLAIESGAQLVVGHHPHVIQGVEVYKGGLIFYSLGNFIFGFYSSPDTEGVIAEVEFETGTDGFKASSARIIPLDVDNTKVKFQTTPLEGQRAEEKLEEIVERSEPFKPVFYDEPPPVQAK